MWTFPPLRAQRAQVEFEANAIAFVVGTAKQVFHEENVDACASATVDEHGKQVLAVQARSVGATQEDMFLIVNRLR